MPRQKGLFSFSGNFEPQIAEPLDSRLRVKSVEALLNRDTWIANDGGLYAYKGMVVAVTDDPDEDNNGLYYLNNIDDITHIDSWLKLSAGGNYITTDYTVTKNGGLKLEGNALSIDDGITFVFDCGKGIDLEEAAIATINEEDYIESKSMDGYIAAENGGLKLEGNAFSIDDSITFVFDSGGSTDLID